MAEGKVVIMEIVVTVRMVEAILEMVEIVAVVLSAVVPPRYCVDDSGDEAAKEQRRKGR